MHLVCYIVRNYYDTRSPERQVRSKHNFYFISNYLATRFDHLHGSVMHECISEYALFILSNILYTKPEDYPCIGSKHVA